MSAQKYTPGKIIRHKQTGKALFVLHVYRTATIVVDLSEKHLPVPRVLFERDYPDWADDGEFESKEHTEDINNPYIEFTHHPIHL